MIANNLRKKSTDELTKLAADLKAELFMLRFQNSTQQLDNTHKIDLVKKDIARTLTVLNDKKAGREVVSKAPAKKKAAPKKTETVKEAKVEEAPKAEAPKAEVKETEVKEAK